MSSFLQSSKQVDKIEYDVPFEQNWSEQVPLLYISGYSFLSMHSFIFYFFLFLVFTFLIFPHFLYLLSPTQYLSFLLITETESSQVASPWFPDISIDIHRISELEVLER